jgi:hypothetical protein
MNMERLGWGWTKIKYINNKGMFYK